MKLITALLKRIRRTLPRAGGSVGRRSASLDASFRLLAENSIDVIFRVGVDGVVRYISPSAEALFGCSSAEMLARGGTVASNGFLHPDDVAMVGRAAAEHFTGKVHERKLEFRILHCDGRPVWVETNCRTIIDDATGRPTDIIFTMRDISEKKAREEELLTLARTDALTGLANRRAFDEALEREWRRTGREGSELSLLILDIDHFKAFNDRNGHQVGDDCLRAVAAAIGGAVKRPGDLVARYGGEEFAVVLPATGRVGAIDTAGRICAAIEALGLPHPDSAASPSVTVSVGAATAMATSGGTMRMPEGLLQAADSALYRAKAGGRNRVESALLLTPSEGVRAAG